MAGIIFAAIVLVLIVAMLILLVILILSTMEECLHLTAKHLFVMGFYQGNLEGLREVQLLCARPLGIMRLLLWGPKVHRENARKASKTAGVHGKLLNIEEAGR